MPQQEPSKNHIFWIIPNYRSDENAAEIKPLTPAEKMKVALDDSFDPSAFLVAGIFAGLSMAQKLYSSFGAGAQGFGKYYVGAFADQAIGNIVSVLTSPNWPTRPSVAMADRVAPTLWPWAKPMNPGRRL